MIDIVHIGVYDRQMEALGIETEVETAMAAIDFQEIECVQDVNQEQCIIITKSGNEYHVFQSFAEVLRQWMMSKQPDYDTNNRTDTKVKNNGSRLH